MIPLDKDSKEDIRLRIKGKYLHEFMTWFDKKIDRETSPYREFYEELIASKILDKDNFSYIMYNYIKRRKFPLKYSEYAQGPELIMADIYELVMNKEQEEEIEKLVKNGNENILWVSEDLIKTRGVVKGGEVEAYIAPTAKWLVS